MTELATAEQSASTTPPAPQEPEDHPRRSRRGTPLLMLGALGVVYGDIGTSPLYAVQTVFSVDDGIVAPTTANVYGIVSLIFWSIALVVSLKYVLFILRADNDGEGGVMALAALVRRVMGSAGGRRVSVFLALGVIGGSLFYGDSVITPSISVLSAMEGLQVSAPSLSHVVVPMAVAVMVVLFGVQRWGTHRVGQGFGPVMFVWFTTIGLAAIPEIARNPGILRALSPVYGAQFIAGRPYVAFVAMGAVVLAITGAESLYADMGHFGRTPIRASWFLMVFPSLTLNYLGQGALIARDNSPRAIGNPFFVLIPSWAQIPMVVLATMATLIASQAVISGAFSVSQQAVRLGFLPHIRIRHTSAKEAGQIYVPGVNWALFVAVLVVTISFGASAKLANAYGVAVTGTFLMTTTLFLVYARVHWHWGWIRLIPFAVIVGSAEITYFTANLAKVAHGGWLTLCIAGTLFTVMMTWQRGRQIVTARRIEMEGPLADFIAELHGQRYDRVPGVAVFPHPTKETTPLALRANVEHNHVLHERVVIITGRTANVPHIPWRKRITIEQLGDPLDGITHVTAEFGFQDPTDFPEVLRRSHVEGVKIRGGTGERRPASYFVSRITLRRTKRPGMVRWRKALFIAMAHNAGSQSEFLGLPDDRTIVMGAQVDL